jgi:hypothetical protein
MSYKTKRNMTEIIAGIILIFVYVILAMDKYRSEDSLSSWATFMLIFIGICVIAMIVVHIIFQIAFYIGIVAKEKDDCENVERIMASSEMEDEMDKLINLKSMRAGYICVGIGFIAALTTLALEASTITALNITFISFMIGAIAEGCVGVYLYRKGVRHG